MGTSSTETVLRPREKSSRTFHHALSAACALIRGNRTVMTDTAKTA